MGYYRLQCEAEEVARKAGELLDAAERRGLDGGEIDEALSLMEATVEELRAALATARDLHGELEERAEALRDRLEVVLCDECGGNLEDDDDRRHGCHYECGEAARAGRSDGPLEGPLEEIFENASDRDR
jgi:hypothetical protein